eukprot:1157049-Pelagomonas_calceolata.AAC.2
MKLRCAMHNGRVFDEVGCVAFVHSFCPVPAAFSPFLQESPVYLMFRSMSSFVVHTRGQCLISMPLFAIVDSDIHDGVLADRDS